MKAKPKTFGCRSTLESKPPGQDFRTKLPIRISLLVNTVAYVASSLQRLMVDWDEQGEGQIVSCEIAKSPEKCGQ